MQFNELKNQLKEFPVFTLDDIRKIEPEFHRRRLNEWQNKGYIKKLRRSHYMFADLPLDEERLFLIANRLYAPSYVSLEMALSFYGLIPEGVYSITSVTSKKTARFSTPAGEFNYRSLKPRLFFGYDLRKVGDWQYKLAEMEKAVLDYLYLNPRAANDGDLTEWRFNGREFLSRVDERRWDKYVKAFEIHALERRARQFINFIKQQT